MAKKSNNKHPAAEARDRWLSNDEGKSCCDGNAKGQYLQNRLERAFMAGWNACEELVRRKVRDGCEN